MREGWQGENYLMLLDHSEVPEFSRRYEINTFLPGHEPVGLVNWDDFLVRRSGGGLFTIPTVPLDIGYLAPTAVITDGAGLVPDERFTGKVKWFKQPLVFGGNPTAPDNTVWIPLDQHAQLVVFWNKTYRRLAHG